MCQCAFVTWDRFRPLGTSVSSLWEDLESTALDIYRVTMPQRTQAQSRSCLAWGRGSTVVGHYDSCELSHSDSLGRKRGV